MPNELEDFIEDVFNGTKKEAEYRYQAVVATLTEVEKYILLRYLRLDVSRELTERYHTMEDGTYRKTLRAAKEKVSKKIRSMSNSPAQKC